MGQAPHLERSSKVLYFEPAGRERLLTQQLVTEEVCVARTTVLGWVARDFRWPTR